MAPKFAQMWRQIWQAEKKIFVISSGYQLFTVFPEKLFGF